MRLRLMSPCVSPIRADIEQAMSVRGATLNLWDRVAAAFPSWDFGADLSLVADADSFPHSGASTKRRPIMYDTIEQDTPTLPAHVIDVGLAPTEAAWDRVLADSIARAAACDDDEDSDEEDGDAEAAATNAEDAARLGALAARLSFAPGSGRLRLYHSRIMIVEFEILFDDAGAACTEQELKDLETLGLGLAAGIAKLADDLVATKLAPSIIALNPHAPVMRLRSAKHRYEHLKFLRAERGPVLWVTRTLIFPDMPPDSPAQEAAAAWLGAVSSNSWRDALERTGYRIEWLRYVINESALEKNGLDLADVWEGLLFAQYFYSLVERLEIEMFDLLGALKGATGKPVPGAFYTLTRAREEAQLTLVHYNHLKRFLARKRFAIASAILDGWGFDTLAANLEEAIAVCDARVQLWSRRSAARSAVYTDILLFVIGSVAIIAFTVDLTIIGRTLSSDAALGLRDEGVFNMAGLLSRLPLDAVLTGGVVLIIVLAWSLYRLRRRDTL